MEYKETDGTILKGFSQVDLDKLNINLGKNNELIRQQTVDLDTLNQNLKTNNKMIKQQTLLYGILGVILLIMILWGFWQIKHYQIITKLIEALGR